MSNDSVINTCAKCIKTPHAYKLPLHAATMKEGVEWMVEPPNLLPEDFRGLAAEWMLLLTTEVGSD